MVVVSYHQVVNYGYEIVIFGDNERVRSVA